MAQVSWLFAACDGSTPTLPSLLTLVLCSGAATLRVIAAANHDSWSNAGSYITVLQLLLTAGVTGELYALSDRLSLYCFCDLWMCLYPSGHLYVSDNNTLYLSFHSVYLLLL